MGTYEEICRSCRQRGVLYEDKDFPANNESLFYSQKVDGIVWMRPGDLSYRPRFMVEGASRFDLHQGSIGNCWFISAAATLATRPRLFEKVVPKDQSFDRSTYVGAFRFFFWQFGKWTEVVVDDRLPTNDGQLIFGRNREETDEYWSALLEKAYAKIHGSYEALVGGFGQDALVDLTGGIGEHLDLEKEKEKTDISELYHRLFKISKQNTLMCAAISPDEDKPYVNVVLDDGLVSGHAYSITQLIKVKHEGRDSPLVRLRNPWGGTEWNGRWSDRSSEWKSLSYQQRQFLGLTIEDDGEFWMAFDDMLEKFHFIDLCHLTPDSVKGGLGEKHEWKIKTFHGEWVRDVTAGGAGVSPYEDMYWLNPQYYVKLAETDDADSDGDCTLVVSLMQKHTRLMRTITRDSDTKVAMGFDLLKFRGEVPYELDSPGTFSKHALKMERTMLSYQYYRERSQRYLLSPGTYCIIPTTFNPNVEGQFLLRIAAETMTEAGESEEVEPPEEPSGESDEFKDLFVKHSGEDNTMDVEELAQMLNAEFGNGNDGAIFTKATARLLIGQASPETPGCVYLEECRRIWDHVTLLLDTFQRYDRSRSDTLEVKELRNACRGIGMNLRKSEVARLARQYGGRKRRLTRDDFLQCITMTLMAKRSNSYSSPSSGSTGIEVVDAVIDFADKVFGISF